MDSKTLVADKPHAVCIPYPVQSHIKAMLKFSKLLHHKGFHITFVNTEFNHQRFLKTRGLNSLDGLSDFRFETIPDSLPPSDLNITQDIPSLCVSIMKNFLAPFSDLLMKLNSATSSNPPVTCIISDGFMPFTITAAQELDIPIVMFFTISACSFMCNMHIPALKDNGITPLKGMYNKSYPKPFLSLVLILLLNHIHKCCSEFMYIYPQFNLCILTVCMDSVYISLFISYH
jgi:hypothetical protein